MNRAPRALLPVLAALLLWGCGEAVQIRLFHDEGADVQQECDLVIGNMQSLYAELERADEVLIFKQCVDLPAQGHQSLAQLENLLADRIAFEGVPRGGSWNVWIEGFVARGCAKSFSPLLCGRESDVTMPPVGGNIDVRVSCVAPGYMWPDGKPRTFWSGAELNQLCRFK